MKTVWIGLGLLAVGFAGALAPRPPAPRKATPRYAESVAPILNRSCVSCHRPGEVAPFSLVGYDNAKRWSKMVANVTSRRLMPPWKATDEGVFHGDTRLSAEDIATLAAWDAAGAPRGDAKKEPKPPIFTSNWALGQPDMIVGPSKPFKVGAEGTDMYRYFVIPTHFSESRWVRAMDTKAGNKKIVHHIIAFVDAFGQAAKYAAAHADGQEGYTFDGGPNFLPDSILGVWAPGMNPRKTPEGTAFELKPGASIVLQVHYNRSGKPEEDQSQVGFYFDKVAPQKTMHMALIDDFQLMIKAGDPDYRKTVTKPLRQGMTLYAVMPHMHMLGQSMVAELELPDGTKRPLINLPDWDFRWQMSYWYKQPIFAPAGSKIRYTGRFDNSDKNPRNPNSPPKDIYWGEATRNEMCMLVVAFTTERSGG